MKIEKITISENNAKRLRKSGINVKAGDVIGRLKSKMSESKDIYDLMTNHVGMVIENDRKLSDRFNPKNFKSIDDLKNNLEVYLENKPSISNPIFSELLQTAINFVDVYAVADDLWNG